MKKLMMQRWIDLCDGASLSRACSIFDDLEHAYEGPDRYWHTLYGHIRVTLDNQTKYFPNSPVDEVLAIWWHDRFLIPGFKRNEEISAAIMRAAIGRYFPPDIIDLAASHIIGTATHVDSPTDGGKRVSDMDMLSVACDPEEYDAGTRLIRKEYGMITDSEWAAGRTIWIQQTLAQSQIFQTEEIGTWFETIARTNLQRELESYG